MLRKIKSLWPQEFGQGWNLCKFHEQLHVPGNIVDHGPPSATHTEPLEHNHIKLVKELTKQTQRRRETLDEQISNRYYESEIISNFFLQMESIKRSTDKPEKADLNLSETKKTSNSSKGKLYIKNEKGLCKGEYGEGSMHLDENAYEYILHTYINEVEFFEDSNGEHCVSYFSECNIKGSIYCADPDYREVGPWFDWAMIRWNNNGEEKWNHETATVCNVQD